MRKRSFHFEVDFISLSNPQPTSVCTDISTTLCSSDDLVDDTRFYIATPLEHVFLHSDSGYIVLNVLIFAIQKSIWGQQDGIASPTCLVRQSL